VTLRIRPLEEKDLDEADRILRLAFDTYLGLKEPHSNFGDRDLVRTRWRTDPKGAFGAELDGRLVGSNFTTRWGSVSYFGPLSVDPKFWNRGIGQRLLESAMTQFAQWRSRHTGLFTFANSPGHAALYQHFDFWPRFVTAIMSKAPVQSAGTEFLLYSEASGDEQQKLISQCASLTNAIYPGLDVGREVRAVEAQNLGDTLLVVQDLEVTAFAVCHVGAGTEAGSGNCYVKFGAARPGVQTSHHFGNLLDACESFADARELRTIRAGVNLGRIESYKHLLGRGFRTEMHGIAMQRANNEGYNRPGVYLLDDWR